MILPFDPTTLLDITERIGLIETVKAKLVRNPDKAADKLAIVIDEVSKIYYALESELVSYLSLNFDPADDKSNLAGERAILLTLEGGQLFLRLGQARGHCNKINNIYQNHLKRWFHRALAPQEAEAMEELFDRLQSGDTHMTLAMEQLSRWLGTCAVETLDLVDDGQLEAAQKNIRAARKQVLPARQAMSQAVAKLVQLQADFIAASGTD